GLWWHCYGCGAHGDAADLVMRLNNVTFPEAVRSLASGSAPSKRSCPNQAAARPGKAPAPAQERSSGLSGPDALALVADAEPRLWTPEWGKALAYLHGRGLKDETIRAARLGFKPDGWPCGIVIPWFDRDRLALVKVRQPEGRKPKYVERYR